LLRDAPETVGKIYVVSSGSTDGTNEIVSAYQRKDARVELIAEPKRNGKARAFNILFQQAEAHDLMVCLGGDNLIERKAIDQLVEEFRTDDVGIVAGRPQPLNGIRNFSDWCSHVVWNMHHFISLRHPKVSGDLFAFRPGVIREIPPGLISDDAYIQNLFQMKGYTTRYREDAKVYLMGPRSIREFFRQRRRVFIGHRQVRFLLGQSIPTFSLRNLRVVRKAMPSRGIVGHIYMLGFIIVTGAAWLASLGDFLRQNLPYKWEMVRTTKELANAAAGRSPVRASVVDRPAD
jgi:cellulose synthase/poly-beta-1,6-N-acetylglucosamine synthase-like glycosyltransferase